MRNRAAPVLPEPVTESYLESLSDLLLGLLFIFIIILMSFSLSLRVETDRNQALNKRLTDSVKLRGQLLSALKGSLNLKGVSVEIDERNGVLRLPENLLFDSGSAEFNALGLRKVQVVARELARSLPCYSGGSLRHCPPGSRPVLDALFIEGHTDNVPITGGPYKDNWELSAARSRETYRALLAGAPALEHQLNENGQPLLSISAYGETRPLSGFGSVAQNQKHSRRIDLRFIVAAPATSNNGL
jgi:flagellar motor protein MotB